MRRGEIWRLQPVDISHLVAGRPHLERIAEQMRGRPVVIVSSDHVDEQLPFVTTCPIRSGTAGMDLLGPVLTDADPVDGHVAVPEITKTHKEALAEQVGSLDPNTLWRVDAALRAYLDLL